MGLDAPPRTFYLCSVVSVVFPAKKSKDKRCPYMIKNANNVDFDSYNSADDATIGHYKMCDKWSKDNVT